MTDPEKRKMADGYANALTGLAGSADKSTYGRFDRRMRLGEAELSAIYEQDAIAARIVDRLVDDATRGSWTLRGESAPFDFSPTRSTLESLDMMGSIASAWRWARLYGGALLLVEVDDSLPVDEPLDLSSASQIVGFQVIESPFLSVDVYDPKKGLRGIVSPEHYLVSSPIQGASLKIHRSRVIRFDGVRVSPARMLANGGWGPSVIDRVYSELSALGEVLGYCRAVLHDISIQVYKITGLREQICSSPAGEAEIRKMLETIRMSTDTLHALAIDSEDEFLEISRTVAGLDTLVEKFVDAVVRASPQPRTIILGEAPSGMNASGDSELRSWFDLVAAEQKLVLTPAITRILGIELELQRQRGIPAPAEFSIDYRVLWQPTERERTEALLRVAQADQIYLLNGVIAPDEIRARLISEGVLVGLDAPDVGELEDPPPQAPPRGGERLGDPE